MIVPLSRFNTDGLKVPKDECAFMYLTTVPFQAMVNYEKTIKPNRQHRYRPATHMEFFPVKQSTRCAVDSDKPGYRTRVRYSFRVTDLGLNSRRREAALRLPFGRLAPGTRAPAPLHAYPA